MNDTQAEKVLLAVQELAIVVRDEGPDAIGIAARAALDAAGGDATAALIIAAALIPVDAPVDPWWRELITEHPYVDPACGTERGYRLHLRTGEPPCLQCRAGHNEDAKRRRSRAS